MRKKLIAWLLALAIGVPLSAQILNDSFYVRPYPVPEVYLTEDAPILPDYVDNWRTPFFPPMQHQIKPTCGQFGGIFNTYTYEYCRLKNLDADLPENQFAVSYTYNFLSGGNGYFGVNFLDSWNIMKSQGHPMVNEFGWNEDTTLMHWMSGYDKYFQSMQRRISDYYKLDVSDSSGLRILQHYLHDHLEGSASGGVAAFNANPSVLYYGPAYAIGNNFLTEGAPMDYIVACPYFSGEATHCMVVAGYVEGEYIDFNEDGMVTDSLDINDDGVVDYHDNERILWLCVNSYGEFHGTNGTYLLKYDGIQTVFNSAVFIPVPDTNYQPELTAKFRISHPYRNNLKISAGIANYTESEKPERILEMPIVHFHGGFNGMPGDFFNPEDTYIEMGLDFSDILDDPGLGNEARIFFIIENAGKENGLLHSAELILYADDNAISYPLNQSDEDISPQDALMLSTVVPVSQHMSDNDSSISIEGEHEFTRAPGDQIDTWLNATGGLPPYTWKFMKNSYQISYTNEDFTGFEEPADFGNTKLIPLTQSFPLGDREFDSLRVYNYGRISFDDLNNDDIYPYEYEGEYIFRPDYEIAPFHIGVPVRSAGGDYEQDDEKISIRFYETVPNLDMERYLCNAELYFGGTMVFHYNDRIMAHQKLGYVKTDDRLYLHNNIFVEDTEDVSYNTVRYTPVNSVQESGFFQISDNGHITGSPEHEGIFRLLVQAEDMNNEKRYHSIVVNVFDENERIDFYPNPMQEEANLRIVSPAKEAMQINIFDVSGKCCYSNTYDLSIGVNKFVLKKSDISLRQGVYFCKIESENTRSTLKFIVL